ncbi:hypothetical protein [Duganella sp. CY15W]|uniref:hypothetical protein n=1 Tax=Duganella sp. CY15W TaxID=2692172 RepID=UPI001E3C1108|nr:hypothetical protein [Duganella sp. CY15W]
MKTFNERSLLDDLIGLMDEAVSFGTEAVRSTCMTWLSGIQRGTSANEACYSHRQPMHRNYRKSSKKIANVRTIHSILSRKFQNALSEEIGAAAAWLLGLWPKAAQDSGVKTVTPPHLSSAARCVSTWRYA